MHLSEQFECKEFPNKERPRMERMSIIDLLRTDTELSLDKDNSRINEENCNREVKQRTICKSTDIYMKQV